MLNHEYKVGDLICFTDGDFSIYAKITNIWGRGSYTAYDCINAHSLEQHSFYAKYIDNCSRLATDAEKILYDPADI